MNLVFECLDKIKKLQDFSFREKSLRAKIKKFKENQRLDEGKKEKIIAGIKSGLARIPKAKKAASKKFEMLINNIKGAKLKASLNEYIKKMKASSDIMLESETEFPGSIAHLASAYKKHFKVKLYNQILSYTKLAQLLGGEGIPEEHALKLSIMFDDANKALNYLFQQYKNKKGNKQFVSQACSFELPENPKLCNFKAWKKLASQNSNLMDRSFKRAFRRASEIEAMMKPQVPKRKSSVKEKSGGIKKKGIIKHKEKGKIDYKANKAFEKRISENRVRCGLP